MLLILEAEHEQQIAQMSELRRQRAALFRHQSRHSLDNTRSQGHGQSQGQGHVPPGLQRSSSYGSSADLEKVRLLIGSWNLQIKTTI